MSSIEFLPSLMKIAIDTSNDPWWLTYSSLISSAVALVAAIILVWANFKAQRNQFDEETQRRKTKDEMERLSVSTAIYAELMAYKNFSDQIQRQILAPMEIQEITNDTLIGVMLRDGLKRPLVFPAFLSRISCLGQSIAAETIAFYNWIYVLCDHIQSIRDIESNSGNSSYTQRKQAILALIVGEGKEFPKLIEGVIQKWAAAGLLS